jgi:hypothetical protein
LLICCGATAREIVSIVERNGWSHMRVESLPADLHNRPDEIPGAARAKIHAKRRDFDRILVLYSDCGTGGGLQAVLDEEGVEGIGGAHCYEMFAGAAAFDDIVEAEVGSFFLTDYLARHFDRLVYRGLGLDQHPELRDCYFHAYRKLVYLAQRDDPELLARAEAAAERLDLEFEMRRTGFGAYQQFLDGVE